jgi:hypothetical protein
VKKEIQVPKDGRIGGEMGTSRFTGEGRVEGRHSALLNGP